MHDLPIASQPIKTADKKLLLLGHRGARLYARENTLAAFDRALQDGCDGFEFDVRLTSDNCAVVCHDPRFVGHEVAASTCNSLLSVEASLPQLADVIQRYSPQCFLYIELKVPGLEHSVASLLRQFPPAHGYVVASFQPDILTRIHAENPRITLGLICDRLQDLEQWPRLPLDYVMPNYRLTSGDLVDRLHRAGKRVLVWTVNSEKMMREVAAVGVDGIVSDDTVLLCRTFGRTQLRNQPAG